MLSHKGYAKKLAKINQRFGRGSGHLNFLITIIKLTAYYALIRELFGERFGVELPIDWGFAGSAIYLITAYIVGWLDEKVGFWKQENAFATEELNPPMKKMIEQVDETYKKVNKILDEISTYDKITNITGDSGSNQ